MSLVSLAASAQSRFMVKIREGYCEPLNLYAICPLEPANRKSAIVAACAEHLLVWEEEQAQKLAPEIKRLKSEKQTIERAIEGERAKAAKARDKQGIQLIQAEINDLETLIPDVPNLPRLLADNTTPEALAALMEQMVAAAKKITAARIFNFEIAILCSWIADIIKEGRDLRGLRFTVCGIFYLFYDHSLTDFLELSCGKLKSKIHFASTERPFCLYCLLPMRMRAAKRRATWGVKTGLPFLQDATLRGTSAILPDNVPIAHCAFVSLMKFC